MNKSILVLQFRTDHSTDHEQTCYKELLKVDNLEFLNVFADAEPDYQKLEPKSYKAVIIAASGQYNVTNLPKDFQKRTVKLTPFLNKLVEIDFPTLAVCFGHQLLAKVQGGEVATDPEQAEAGTVEITLTENGRNTKIFQGLPEKFYVASGHKDSVTHLPDNASSLASSQKTNIQSYQIKNNIFGVQFHPELDLDALAWRLSLYPEYRKGRTIEDIKSEYHETPFATQVLKNFVTLVVQNHD